MFRTLAIALATAVFGASQATGCGFGYLLDDVTSPEETTRQAAIDDLRAMGPRGLQAALNKFDVLQAELDNLTAAGQGAALRTGLDLCREAVDQIAGQRHATTSRLFWYTDLEKAKEAAAESEKPILSLRLLGKLTDEYSCANSRFFRTALYANQEIGDLLRERFVLHWQTVRPVPKVTIDFGDGRKLERTVCGNSAHYILSTDGRPLDVLPGLYGPKWFHGWLKNSDGMYRHFKDVAKDHRHRYLALVHAQRFTNTGMRLSSDLHKLGRLDVLEKLRLFAFGNKANASQLPKAWEAEPVVQVTKAGLETPVLRLFRFGGKKIEKSIDEELWNDIASLHREGSRLDGASVELMRREYPTAWEAQPVAMAKAVVERPILRIVRNFEDSIALDSVRNDYLLHRRIHVWFARGDATDDFDALNERVYAELFLTPSSDPWLGLVPTDSYTALENSGLSTSESR